MVCTTVCHQVLCMYMGHLCLFHRDTFILIDKNDPYERFSLYTYHFINSTNMSSIYWNMGLLAFPLKTDCRFNTEPHCSYVCVYHHINDYFTLWGRYAETWVIVMFPRQWLPGKYIQVASYYIPHNTGSNYPLTTHALISVNISKMGPGFRWCFLPVAQFEKVCDVFVTCTCHGSVPIVALWSLRSVLNWYIHQYTMWLHNY